ncbi:MAG: glycosyltransferase [Nitrospira sp.]|nr:glycosyltransferase [Nitrospira sp.]
MAAGRPVISWEIPNRPRTKALFQDNQEIVLFSAHSPESLAGRIEYVLSDSKRADSIGSRGRRKLLAYHTAERRMQQVLEWIESGKEPDYGVPPAFGERPIDIGRPSVVKASPWTRSQAQLPSSTQPTVEPNVQRKEAPTIEPKREDPMNSDDFYINLFVKAPVWSTPEPNADEAARWSKIATFLEYILRRVRQQEPNKQLRMLDVGCGRGWLTNLATAYGTCEGIEPVAGVVEWARKLFPYLRIEAGMAESVLSRPDFAPYDVVLTFRG